MDQSCNRMSASGHLLGLGQRMAGRSGSVSVGELVDTLGSSAIGMVLIFLTLPTLIPIPGPFGLVFGTILMLVSAQLLFGVRRLWLPEMVRQRMLPVGAVARMVDVGAPILLRAEAALKPRRMLPLTGRLGRIALAVPMVLLALAIALPIPLGNIPPALSMIVIALGLVVRDGIAIVIGLILSIFAGLWAAAILLFGAEIIAGSMLLLGWE